MYIASHYARESSNITYDDRRMESLLVVPISQVSAQQRAGRAGRTGKHLYVLVNKKY